MISLKWEFKSWDVWQLLTSMIDNDCLFYICSSTSSSSNRPVKAAEVHSLEFSPMTLCRRAEGRTYAVTKNSQRSPVYALRGNNIKQYEQSHGSTGSVIKRSLSCSTNALDAVSIEIVEHHWIILNHWTSVIPKDCTSTLASQWTKVANKLQKMAALVRKAKCLPMFESMDVAKPAHPASPRKARPNWGCWQSDLWVGPSLVYL